MELLASGITPLGMGTVLAALDLDGYLMGNEFLSLIAALFSAFFSGLAGVFAGNLFNGGT